MRQRDAEGHPGVLLVVLVVALFALMAGEIRYGPFTGPEGAMLGLFSPILEGFHSAAGWAQEAASYATGADSPSTIRELQREVMRLELEQQRLREQSIENARLRALLDLKSSLPSETLAATVLSNSSRGLAKTCLIDRGEEDGIRPDMPVVNSQGLVGRVRSVSAGVAKVQLITDAASGVAVLVQRSRVQGVLVGRGDPVLELRYVSTLDDVQPSDLLLTSGLDGIYPAGLPVGVVAEVGEGAEMLRSISVVPRVEFNRLEEVLVLAGGAPPAAPDGDEP